MGSKTGLAAERYAALHGAREVFLRRARDAATLTIPYLIPPLGFNATMSLPTPYQSLGARGVRNLASKLLLALFPTNTTFFKYEIDDFLLEEISKVGKVARGDFELAMSRRERAIMVEINKALVRVVAAMALMHLIVAGNFLLHCPKKGRARGFRLDQYVVRRDPEGNVLEIVVKEPLNIHTLPQKARDAIAARAMDAGDADGDDDDKHKGTGDKTSDLYTRIYLGDDGMWHVNQECEGVVIPDSDGTYPLEANEWLPLRWSTQPCEDYGRGYVEEFLGDLDSLEGLSETLVEGIAAVARVIFLVKPNGVTNIRMVSKARNGDVRAGNAEDVTVVQAAHKSADFQTAQKQAETIATRLSYAFMLNSTVQRNAERVTAEEIRYVAGELDDALGGLYTLLAAEFQLPVVAIYERRMQEQRKVPPLPKGVAEPTITTGLEAIGRGNDLQAMKAWVTDVIQVVGPDTAFKYIAPAEFLKRSAAAYGVDTSDLMRSDEEVKQSDQQAQLQELVQKLGPQAISAAGGLAQTAMQQQPPTTKQG
jgi:hypothetical protein